MKSLSFLILSIVFIVLSFVFWGGDILTDYTIKSRISELRDSTDFCDGHFFLYTELDSLAPILKAYFKTIVKDKAPKPNFITLAQTAYIRTDVDSEWKKLDASECFTTHKPNFIWSSTIRNTKFLWMHSVDSYVDGLGNMLIKLNSSITISDAWNIEMNRSGLFRYFSEALFFPTSLFPSKNLHWNILDSNTAEIKYSDSNNSIVAKVFFSKNNTISKIQTLDKFRSVHGNYVKTLYTIYYSNYKWLTDYYFIPTHFEVEWDLPEGKFRYGKFDITDIMYE